MEANGLRAHRLPSNNRNPSVGIIRIRFVGSFFAKKLSAMNRLPHLIVLDFLTSTQEAGFRVHP